MLASIPSPSSNGLALGPFEIRFYGLLYVVALLAAIAITSRRWEREGGSRELVHEVALWGFPAGLVGARLYYVVTSWDQVPDEWWGAAGRLAGRPWDLGRDRRGDPRRRAGPAPTRCGHPALHGRSRASTACRAGNRTRRQLRQPGAIRRLNVHPSQTGLAPT
jgi:hypothetical protein